MGGLIPQLPQLPEKKAPRKTSLSEQQSVLRHLVSIQQLKQLVTFVKNGGKMAAWSVLGLGIGLIIGIALNMPSIAVGGVIGSLIGVGVYGARIFQKHKDPGMESIYEKLSSLQNFFDLGLITRKEYAEARRKILEKMKP